MTVPLPNQKRVAEVGTARNTTPEGSGSDPGSPFLHSGTQRKATPRTRSGRRPWCRQSEPPMCNSPFPGRPHHQDPTARRAPVFSTPSATARVSRFLPRRSGVPQNVPSPPPVSSGPATSTPSMNATTPSRNGASSTTNGGSSGDTDTAPPHRCGAIFRAAIRRGVMTTNSLSDKSEPLHFPPPANRFHTKSAGGSVVKSRG